MNQFTGQFWVERNGQHIDYDFPQYARIRRKHDCVREILVHLEAPPETQDLIICLYKKITLKAFDTDNWDEMMEEFVTMSRVAKVDKPMFGKAFQNCLLEIYYNGGELHFGSLGFKKKDGTYHWEYGSPEFMTVKDFRKN